MKILHVGQMIGGLDVYIRNSITYISNDYEFILATGEKDVHQIVKKNNIPIKEYKIKLYRSLNPIKDIWGLIQLLIIIRNEKPNIIHCHSAKGGVLGRIAGWLTNTKTFYTPHAFSFLSTQSQIKRNIYLLIERLVKFDSFLLACSESEKELGIKIVHYTPNHAFAWNNAVPDSSVILANENE